MGYHFSPVNGGSGFDIPDHEMIDVREVLRIGVGEAGADCPVEMHKFASNDGLLVTPEECREIARLLGGQAGEWLVSDYRTFVDEVSGDLAGNIRALADFSADAAERGGFRVL